MKYNTTFSVESVVPDLVEHICQENRRKTLRNITVHLDNARSHNNIKSEAALTATKVCGILTPVYSPDLSPSNFFLSTLTRKPSTTLQLFQAYWEQGPLKKTWVVQGFFDTLWLRSELFWDEVNLFWGETSQSPWLGMVGWFLVSTFKCYRDVDIYIERSDKNSGLSSGCGHSFEQLITVLKWLK
jgi:hypothetical protein